MTSSFIVFCIIQSVIVISLCSVSIYYFSYPVFRTFLSVDMVTLFIAVIFLSLILLVVGWSSASSNLSCVWAIFHAFMIILLIIEISVSFLSSSIVSFLANLSEMWSKSEQWILVEIQNSHHCCGYYNLSDRVANPCSSTISCFEPIQDIVYRIRNYASVAMFVSFTFGLFIDFAGCAICFHPETISLIEHERETEYEEQRFTDFNNSTL